MNFYQIGNTEFDGRVVNRFFIWAFYALTLGCSAFFSHSSQAFDLEAFKRQLANEGATLEVHGIDSVNKRYVATARSKSDFFDYQHFALLGATLELREKIKTFKRHDLVKVKGRIDGEKDRPFLHIVAESLDMLKAYDHDIGTYEYKIKLPDDLLGQDNLIAKVHAQDPSGKKFVADYEGSILPVVVPAGQQEVAKKLNRGDIIHFSFELRDKPKQVTHLNLKDEAGSLEIIESVTAMHGKPVEYSGDLVLFPKSPQVRFNVFAFQRSMREGLTLEYTLVNFESPEVFMQIREKLQKAWDESPIEAKNDRNKLIKKGLRVTAKGIVNYQDPNQANPQIILKSPDDLMIQ